MAFWRMMPAHWKAMSVIALKDCDDVPYVLVLPICCTQWATALLSKAAVQQSWLAAVTDGCPSVLAKADSRHTNGCSRFRMTISAVRLNTDS